MQSYIRDNVEKFSAALEAGDSDGIAAVYTKDARLLAQGVPMISGVSEIAQFWQYGIDAGISQMKLTVFSIEEFDSRTIEIGGYEMTISKNDSESATEIGKYLIIHRRDASGSWLWDVDMYNTDAPVEL